MVWVPATTTRKVHSYLGLLSGTVHMKSGLRTAALLGAATCILQPAATFVLRLRPGAFNLSTVTGSRRIAGIRHPRHANLIRLTHDEGDLLGAADTRITGWRSPKAEDLQSQDSEDVDGLGPMKDEEGLEPACGDVVEYPLSEGVKRDAKDGREKGVGVIVTINKLRNDAWKLPRELLDRAEIQALCPDTDAEIDIGADSGEGVEGSVWMADELEYCAFAELGDLRVSSRVAKIITLIDLTRVNGGLPWLLWMEV